MDRERGREHKRQGDRETETRDPRFTQYQSFCLPFSRSFSISLSLSTKCLEKQDKDRRALFHAVCISLPLSLSIPLLFPPCLSLSLSVSPSLPSFSSLPFSLFTIPYKHTDREREVARQRKRERERDELSVALTSLSLAILLYLQSSILRSRDRETDGRHPTLSLFLSL